MSKPWSEQPLWWKCFMRPDRIYMTVGQIVGHLGCDVGHFWDRAAKLPNFEKWRFESAVHELTRFDLRQPPTLRMELYPHAKKVLRLILGPAPDDPDYAAWWRARLISVRQMREEGIEPQWAAAPPVPLEPEAEAAKEEQPAAAAKPKRVRKKKEAG